MIDLAAVESLVAVERCGSVGGAAAELGFTPSAVSQQVKRLERQVGATLLERAGRGVVLTAAGRRLVDEGRVLGEQVERLRSRLQGDAGRPSGLLRLAAFSTAVRGIVPPLLGELAHRAPGPRRRGARGRALGCRGRGGSGRTDVAIVHRWEGMRFHVPPSLRGEPVLTDVADLLVHRDDPLAAEQRRGARRPARPRLGVHAGGHHLPRVVRPHVPRHRAHPAGGLPVRRVRVPGRAGVARARRRPRASARPGPRCRTPSSPCRCTTPSRPVESTCTGAPRCPTRRRSPPSAPRCAACAVPRRLGCRRRGAAPAGRTRPRGSGRRRSTRPGGTRDPRPGRRSARRRGPPARIASAMSRACASGTTMSSAPWSSSSSPCSRSTWWIGERSR